jgi:hypothetical protein
MTVFPEQEIHPTIPAAINRTFDSLQEDWCYENTQFTVDQLRLIHLYLDLPPIFFIREGCTHCSSEECSHDQLGQTVTTVEKTLGGGYVAACQRRKNTGKVVECPYILYRPILRNFATFPIFFVSSLLYLKDNMCFVLNSTYTHVR